MIRIKCPHCKHPATIRTSRPMSDTVQEHQIQCTNVQCAHTWVAHTSAVRTIAPSMTPDEKVYIPISPRSPSYVKPDSKQLGLALECQNPREMALNSS
ncbi:MAG: ogr/Delta-like zinc finger family protein [Sterolibacterium sp.]|nr:ogr/Delta-like zinc finger family protein [Sterolibacterium sp.]